jgi:sugar phosphate isomerase/epimerase
MRPGLSTYVFLPHRLQAGLLDAMLRGLAPYGDPVIEVFAARHHFDYTDRSAVRDLALWFRDAGIQPTLHQPVYKQEGGGSHWSRHVSATLSLIDPEKSRRIDAMDEVKRALESAEQIPFTALTLHLGLKDDPWNLRALENSLTAIEHLKAFAHPLGVRILLENLQNEVTTPEHLLEILNVGHFTNVGIALDVGHAHLAGANAIDEAVELLRPRIATLNLHDNHATKDDHLWPAIDAPAENVTESDSPYAAAIINWPNIARHLTTLPAETPAILEVSYELNAPPESVTTKASTYFSDLARQTESRLHSNPA